MGQHVRLLRQGERIFKPVYDHSDGTFGKPELITPRSVVLVHGLFGLFTTELRRSWDVSVYLDPHPDLRVAWKIKRDTTKRGYTRAEVLKQLADRQQDADAYIVPQREAADIVISFCPPPGYEKTLDNTRLNVRITLRHPVPLPDLEEAVEAAEQRNGGYLRLVRGEENEDLLEIGGEISAASTAAIEDRMWSHMPTARHLRSDQLGVFQDGDTKRRSNPLAVTQLVLTYYLVKANALAVKEEMLART
jgi:phosphoribulokinase